MEIAESIYEFFELSTLESSATFIDVINNLIQIGVSIWITMFIIKCMFMACTFGERSFF